MKLLSIAVSIYLLVVFGDRLRQISWRSTKPWFVTLYLSHMLWAVALVCEALAGTFDLHDLAGAVAMAVFLKVTRPNWATGAPRSFYRHNVYLQQPDL